GGGVVGAGRGGGGGGGWGGRGWVRPPLRVEEGIELARVAHALIDLSDGLARDAAHVAERSGCRLVVDLERVPLAPGATPDDLAFGEDFELLAAASERLGFAEIRHCEEGAGLAIRSEGQPVALRGGGGRCVQ